MNYFRTSRDVLLITLILISICWYLPAQTGAAASELDPSFGDAGKVSTNISNSADFPSDEIRAIALQTDGKIVAAGLTESNDGDFDFALARYNSNGSLDISFGAGGKVITDFFGENDQAAAIVIQPDGRIIVAGIATNSSFFDFGLARYNSNGSLDTSFGTGGKVTTDFFGDFDSASAVAVLSDGKIIAAGAASSFNIGIADFALVRYNSDGSLDTTFGNSGKVITDFFGSDDIIESLAIQIDGKLVVAGFTTVPGGDPTIADQDFALARYNADGSLDNTFGSGGKVNTDFFNAGNLAFAVAIQPDGKIVAGGKTSPTAGTRTLDDFALARYNANGSLDNTFGDSGKVVTDFSVAVDSRDIMFDLALQTDGKIIGVGFSSIDDEPELTDFALARYNPNGQLDTTFGSGKFTTDFFSSDDAANAVVIQPDAKIIVGGSSTGLGTANDFALARYKGDSGLQDEFDICLQGGSSGELLRINSMTGNYQFNDCTGLTISGRGTLRGKGCSMALQHNAPDRRVMAMVDSCKNRGTASVQILSPRRTYSIADLDITNSCACR